MSRPEDTVPLDALVELRLEKVASYKDPDLPYVGLEHLAAGRPKLLGTLPSSASVSINGVFAQDDILFGKLRPNLRKSLRTPFPGYCSTDILVLRARDGIRSDFAGHLFQWEPIFASAAASAAGTKMPRTSWGELKRYPVRQPESEAEQARIAAVLDTADEAIAKTEAVIEKLRQVRTGLIHDLLTCGLDENGYPRDPIAHPEQFQETQVGTVPTEWEVHQLATRVGVFGGKRLPMGHSYAEAPTTFRYLRVLDFFEREIDFNALVFLPSDTFSALSHYEIRDGELFISIAGSIGYVGVLRPESAERFILTENAARLTVLDGYLPEFLALLMNSEAIQRQINIEKGTGGGVPKLALHRIEKIWLARPSEIEQQRILETISVSEILIRREITELDKLRVIKSGLMDDLLTGRVRVPEVTP
jgi:type I restriction enzyme, S subunit